MTAADPRAVFVALLRSVIPPAYGTDFDGMDTLVDLLVEREAKVRAAVAEEIAAVIDKASQGAYHDAIGAYDHAAQLARDLRVPYCGDELHGADGGKCPGCGFDPYALEKATVAEAEQVWTGDPPHRIDGSA